MEILVKIFHLRYQHLRLFIYFIGVASFFMSCNSDERIRQIPGKFIVVWNDSLHAPRFTDQEKGYYDTLTLVLNRNFTFKFNFDFEKKGTREGIWKFDGPTGKKLLYLKYENHSWDQVSTCLDTGWTFAYPIQVLDSNGYGRCLTFKKIENFK